MRKAILIFYILAAMVLLKGADDLDIAVVRNAPVGVYVFRGGEWMEMRRGDVLFTGEKIKTPYDGFASLLFVNSASVLLRPMSECEIGAFSSGNSFDMLIRISQGGVFALSGNGRLDISFLESTVSCEKGSSLFAEQKGDSLKVHMVRGKCTLENDAGGADILQGETGTSVSQVSPFKTKSEKPEWEYLGGSTSHRISIEFENGEGDTVFLDVEAE